MYKKDLNAKLYYKYIKMSKKYISYNNIYPMSDYKKAVINHLNKFCVNDDSTPTHQSYSSDFKGKFKLDKEANKEFIKLYNDAINNNINDFSIIERQNDYSSLLVDIDLNGNINDGKRLYNDEIIKSVGKHYIKAIKHYLKIPSEEIIAYLFEKPEATKKDGFHLVFPDIITNTETRKLIYKKVVESVEGDEIFEDFDEPVNKIIDKAVISSNGWHLYGSKNPENNQPYKLTKKFNCKMKEQDLEEMSNKEIIKKFSLFGITEKKGLLLKQEAKPKEIKPKKPVQKQINESLISDDEITFIMENIDEARADDYDSWLLLHMVFINEKLNYELFNDFSKKSKKYNEHKNNSILKNIQPKKGLTKASLYYWLKQDNPEAFKTLMQTNNYFFDEKNINNHQLAILYYNMNPSQYIFDETIGWYSYNKFNILRYHKKESPTSLLNDISLKLQLWLDELKKGILLNDEAFNAKMKILKHAYKTVGSSSFIKGVIDYLKNMYKVEDLIKKIDNNKNVIAFENMLYDLEIGHFRRINYDDYIVKTTKYNINIKANPTIRKQIQNLLWTIFENERVIDFWKLSTALSCFGKSFESLYIHTGRGRNGKGVLSTILKAILGDYFLIADNTFLTTAFRSGQANPILANSKGARFLLVTEPDNGTAECALNLDFVKSMTGNDEITARKLFEDNITFKPFFSLTLQCNQKPKLSKIDKAIEERLKIINYPFTFVDNPILPNQRKKDNNLKDEVIKEEFINEFMLMLLEVATNDKDIPYIELPEEVKAQNKEYIDENNSVLSFLKEMYDITNDEKDKILSSDLLTKYKRFSEDEKMDSRKFKKLMEYNGFESDRKTAGIFYFKLKEKQNMDPDSDEESNKNLDI